jgi:methyl coenzyme M reductase subunit C
VYISFDFNDEAEEGGMTMPFKGKDEDWNRGVVVILISVFVRGGYCRLKEVDEEASM